MEKKDGFTLFVAAVIVVVLLFQGFITLIKKSLHSNQKPQPALTDTAAQEQKWKMKEIKDRQKRLMEDQKQRIRDLSNR